ncbi:hypothetical protein MTF65_18345 [Streptomyces sp. APSN-46.1]|uniref:hypothetical protein n=1 Tax=Streptomyces sp. APSN-46.1 TaxID=2929049 RepID=UPI001FB4F9FA|nr:hypothetical protein [Streptomyces sp. APSN-46.1]MCJ1679268.1 hypothetical protein [Streptomyces sp. APSN-46.1]
MRPSTRIPGILAGLALAVGGIVFAAPAAHADIKACEQVVAQQGKQVTGDVTQACYVGQIGDQTSCVSSLEGAGVSNKASADACRAATK